MIDHRKCGKNEYFVFSYGIKEQDGDIVVEYVFGRRLTGFIVTTMLPTVSANIIGYVTVFFVDEAFEAAIGVNLTIMLVIITM